VLEKIINYEGNQFVRGKKIREKNKIYIEYRNNELQKIKFFEVHYGIIKEVTDEDDLKEAIKNNYIISENF